MFGAIVVRIPAHPLPMSSEILHSEAAARHAALTCLREEHRALARVIEALATLTAQAAEDAVAPDFPLLAALLYYIDTFPERVHHAKEERHLFSALRRRSPESAAVLDRLEREHRRSPDLLSELERALVHWQGGAPDGLHRFALALTRFCDFSWAHMRTEETSVLPQAERVLADADWLAMAQAFAASAEPLFAIPPRREYERLHQRIAGLAPRTLDLALIDGAAR
jgi:hemerythrin-like domain-containing protein